MSDEVVRSPWQLDQQARHAVVIDLARELVKAGDLEWAVGACEELLDADPDDIDALLLIAEVAPRYGHGLLGVLAAQQAAVRGAESTVLEAAASLAARQINAALALAGQATASMPNDARAWSIACLALDCLGRFNEADAAQAEASRLDPQQFPLPVRLDAHEWDQLLMVCLSRLIPNERDRFTGWELEFRDAPTVEMLDEVQPPLAPDAGLVDHLSEGKIYLFRRNLARGCQTEAELEAKVTTMLREESQFL